jgi:hypothetical protein
MPGVLALLFCVTPPKLLEDNHSLYVLVTRSLPQALKVLKLPTSEHSLEEPQSRFLQITLARHVLCPPGIPLVVPRKDEVAERACRCEGTPTEWVRP